MLRPEGSKRVELMLDYFPNADHAPIYAAEAAGHFEEAGIDVEIRQPPDPAAPLKQLAAGRVDLAISYEPEVLRARDKGLNVVSVGALVQRPLTSIISLPERQDPRAGGPRRARPWAPRGSTTSPPTCARSCSRRASRRRA